MRISGKLIFYSKGSRELDTSMIEVSPLELLEQITHKEVGELLELINLPKAEAQHCCCYEAAKPSSLCPIHANPAKPEAKLLNKIERSYGSSGVPIAFDIEDVVMGINNIIDYLKQKESKH